VTDLGGTIAAVGRELQRLVDNRYPTVAPAILGQSADGVVTGTLGAADPDGDPLRYTVISSPALGRVTVDESTGGFTYTPVADLAAYGGTDSFTVAVRDQTGPALHGLQGLLNAPIDLIRHIPFVGSLLSDYLPVTTTTATVSITVDAAGTVTDMKFPQGFHWGVSSAGFQSEMGAGAPSDVNSDWWQWTHDPVNRLLLGWKGAVPENGPGAYTQYPVDIALARDGVGADTFRMGIEWSRIFPNSTAAVDISNGITSDVLGRLDLLADQDAVSHYRDVLTAMHVAGLDPMVTVNHFTVPVWVHDPAESRLQAILGGTPTGAAGWVSPDTATEFEKYAAYLAWKFGPQVTNWVVLNEPVNSMLTSYYAIPLATNFPPALFRPDLVAEGLRNQAAAYSASYDLIHRYDNDAQVGFALNMYSWRPANPENLRDQQAAATFSEFYNRWFPDAVIRGDVDADFDGVITADEHHPDLAGKADFFGVNYYSQGIVVGWAGPPDPALPRVTGYPEFAPLLNVVAGGCPAPECSDTAQIIYPAGFRDVLDVADSYGIPLWVTENGVADAEDTQRPSYVVRHLAVLNKAIADGMDIRGYIAWALTDNLEWVLGYDPKYGLYSYDPVTLQRTPRPSVGLLHDIFTGNGIDAAVLRGYLAGMPSA
jgi:beta-glucosidase/6-phospho-beta-glucosidase/beta-galactosidase